jgi:hypothetical protein
MNAIFRIMKFAILGLLILTTACSAPVTVVVQPTGMFPAPIVQPTQDINAIYTAAAQTFQAQMPTQSITTATVVSPTSTQIVAVQPTAASAPVVTGCQDSAQYVSDDGMDGTTYASNTAFTKTWRLKNTGSCTWNSSYMVFQISGTYMTQQPGYWILPQGQTVAPGQTVNISVGMTSPVDNGNYQSYWGLKNTAGQFLPIQGGANGNSFYVKLSVNDGSVANGNVTAASIDIELEQGSGAVCTADSTYLVHAYITADGSTTASYEIGSTAGQIPAGNFTDGYLTPVSSVEYGTVIFDQAGTKTISYRFVGPYPYPNDITVNLRVNGGEWHNTKLSCQ